MKITRLLIIMSALLFLFLQGCVTAPGPDYGYYANGGSYGPPPIRSNYSPSMVVIPDTNDVYFASDLATDLFFWDGYWWQPWRGSWYYSRNYNRNWSYFRGGIPSFYYSLDHRWRDYYRSRHWHGHRWDYERIPSHKLQRNWKKWQKDHYWERERSWGVHDYRPKSQHRRQDLRDHKESRHQEKRSPVSQSRWQPQVQEPRRQPRFDQVHRQSGVEQAWTQPRAWQLKEEPRTQQPQRRARIEETQKQRWDRHAVKSSRGRQPEKEPEVQQRRQGFHVEKQQGQPRDRQIREHLRERQVVKQAHDREPEKKSEAQKSQKQLRERQAVKQARIQQLKEKSHVQQRSKEETKVQSSRRQLEREHESRKGNGGWERNDWIKRGRE